LLGAFLQGLTIAVIWLNNGFHVVSVNPWMGLWPLVFRAAAVAIVEETLFRGILFRISEEKLGTYLALALSALIFGALHLLNAHSTIASALAVAVEGRPFTRRSLCVQQKSMVPNSHPFCLEFHPNRHIRGHHFR
jgi:membrane protease YdiL (CAAX protease family)